MSDAADTADAGGEEASVASTAEAAGAVGGGVDVGSGPDTAAEGAVASPGDDPSTAGQPSFTGSGGEDSGTPEQAAEGDGSERKPRRTEPIDSGAALSGDAAQLLAAVRAVESGERSARSFYAEAPRSAARRAPAPASAAPSVPPPGRSPEAGQPRPVDADALGAIREVLAAGGAPEALAERVGETLGEGAAEVLRTDPWQLLAVPGVTPDNADGFARALLGGDCGPDDPRRALALVGRLLEQAARKGHTALESGVLGKALAQYAVPDAAAALDTAIGEGAVLVFHEVLGEPAAEGEEPPTRILLGLDRYALAEESLADGLARVRTTFRPEDDRTAGGAAAWEAVAVAAPSPSAGELIRASAEHGLVLHTGGDAARAEPVALTAAALTLGLRAYTAAYTPAGRQQAAALLGAPDGSAPVGDTAGAPDGGTPGLHPAAVTLAGLLDGTEGPGRDEEGLLPLDLLVVLDAPQLDVEAAAALVEALPDGVRLVLSGDPAALQSTGPGRVFADLTAAKVCPQVASRTPDPGPIGELVSGIGIGELAEVDAPGKEVVIVQVRDADEAVLRTVQLVADSVPRALGVPAEQTQVITVGPGGAVGTRALNEALKARLNPGPGKFGGFDPGDRVLYGTGPGRTLLARVRGADEEGLRLDGEDGSAPVVSPRLVPRTVRHAWALTAEQAAGRRWPAAVAVVPGDAGRELTRAWAYTAFSRGERHLSVVHGAGPALAQAIAQTPARERTTRLRTLLTPQEAAAE
ncbi:helix-hairpin-helix domain-containing protein [Streptomyces sp. NPDC051940]|uniref:helix-hairpin-helix domain-containing protein n=1 Tax=Streptomyces sp. NPDC051940 TaxID=3155675 RepID=UPI00341AAB08